MATGLPKQLIPISFGTGVDTKTDPKQQVDGKFRVANNVVFETLKLAKKRPGYDRIVLKDTAGDMVQNLRVLTKFKNELNLLTNTDFYSYSSSRNVLINRGQVFNVQPTTETVVADSYQYEKPDADFVENYKVFAWRNVNTGEIRYSVVDRDNGSAVIANDQLAPAGNSPKVSKIQNFVYIFYEVTGTLYYRRFSILTPQTLGTAVSVTTDINVANPNYDIVSSNDRIYVTFYSEASPTVKILYINADETLSSLSSLTAQTASSFIDIVADSLDRIIITYGNETELKYTIFNLSLLVNLLVPTLVETIGSSVNATIGESSPSNYKLFYEIAPDVETLSPNYIKIADVDFSGTVGTPEILLRSAGLASKSININNEIYILSVFNSESQSTYFLINELGKITAKINPNNAGTYLLNGSLPKVSQINDTTFLIPGSVKSKLSVEDSTFSFILGVTGTEFEFNLASPYQVTQLGDNSHIAGGVLKMYDGESIVEHGFHVYPEGIRASVGSPISATTTASVVTVEEGDAGTREVQKILLSSAPGGDWVSSWRFPFNGLGFSLRDGAFANAAGLQAEMNDIGKGGTSLGLGRSSKPLGFRVSVTGSLGAGYDVTFIKPVTNLEPLEVVRTNGSPKITVSTLTQGVAPTQEQQTINFIAVPEAGTWTITIGANTTAALNFAESLAGIKTAIEALPGINTVFVSGSYEDGIVVNFVSPADPGNEMVITSSLTHSDYGGEMSDGSRGYCAVYSWTDNFGQIHRSAPSEILDVEFQSGNNTQSATITIPTLRLTDKSNVNIELYRTEANGTVFYKVTNLAAPLINDPTVDSVQFLDGLSDSEIISREPLYNTGGVLENIAAPACTVMAASSERIAVAGIDRSPYTVIFSKIKAQFQPVEFTDSIERDIDPVGGTITALAFLADKWIIFTEQAIFFIAGQGPSNLGQQDDFTVPEQIATDVGCANPRSIVVTPVGLMFRSSKGIYLLKLDMNLEYIGFPVEIYNNLEITSAEIITQSNQVRFTTDTEICLVYNYQVGLWGTFSNHNAIGAEVADNVYYYLRSNEELFKQNLTKYSDGDVPITQTIETGWINLAAIQGFARIYKLLIVGDFKSNHKLRISIAYDFKEAYVQTTGAINPLDFIDNTPYGEHSPYGEPTDEPYGGDGNLYQLRVDLTQQKCQSIRIKIEELQSEAGQGLTLSAMTIQAGLKVGTNKLPVENKFGTE